MERKLISSADKLPLGVNYQFRKDYCAERKKSDSMKNKGDVN